MYYEDHMKYFRVSVQSNGHIRWFPSGVYRTTCPLTVTYFPYDSQVKYHNILTVNPFSLAASIGDSRRYIFYLLLTPQICEIRILSWDYDVTEQNIMTFWDDIKFLSHYIENGQWRIAETSACTGDINGQLVFLKVIQIQYFSS